MRKRVPRQPERQSVESRIGAVGSDLARTFKGVLNALPGSPHRPQWLARSLGVNTVLTSRILKAAQQHDPLAVAHMIPGPEPLRRLLRAAEKKKVDANLISQARAAVDRFQQLIDVEAGDRSALDALISGWLPDAREKVELLAKQSVFRGMSQLLGATCDVELCSMLIYPSDAGDRADELCLHVTRGLRRVRPGLSVKYDTVHATGQPLTVKGDPVEGVAGLLLEQFCSKPLPKLRVSHLGDRAQYTLTGDGVGVPSAINLVHATLLRKYKDIRRARGEPARKAVVSSGVATPSRAHIFDVLLHEDIFPDQQPALRICRGTVGDGAVNADNIGSDINRVDVIESIQSLGQGISKFRSTDTPDYQDMLRYVCEQRQWDGDKLRGFRCRVEYPVYSSQIVMAFDLPERARA